MLLIDKTEKSTGILEKRIFFLSIQIENGIALFENVTLPCNAVSHLDLNEFSFETHYHK
jgi:hypothetical protein